MSRIDAATGLRHDAFADGSGEALSFIARTADGMPVGGTSLDSTHDVVGIGVNATAGALPYLFRNTATFTTQTIKASGGTLYAFEVSNASAATAFVSVYDLAKPTLGTTVPVLYAIVPAGTTVAIPIGGPGCGFQTAITVFSATADNGATGSAAGVTVSGRYF